MTASPVSTRFVAIACGGTGGHLFPGLAVAEQLVNRQCSVSLLISPKDVDQEAVKSARGMEVVTLAAVALQRGSRLAFVRGFWQSWRASRRLFKSRPPQAALAMGGFTSAPPILAARACGARTFLHESNTIPGRANRWLARFVCQAFVGFPQAAERLHARDITVTGTPVRTVFRPRDVDACRTAMGFRADQPVILVMGGSQGAGGVNELILSALPLFAERVRMWQWLHLAGPADAERVRQTYAALGLKAVVHSFLAEMDSALGAASAVVSRAGASSLAELAAMRVPSLLVPYPFASDNHQYHNAFAFEQAGAARLVEQGKGTPEQIVDTLVELVTNTSVREKMQIALTRLHAPNAAEEIAETILKAVSHSADSHVPESGSKTERTRIAGSSRSRFARAT
jgi:UDP-N-acetylglucosamine--N-acetylmuramyl-(pentapeptide) pyrophosphoryl-undecaprenol N-acetylglucosamine transferase